MSQMRLRHKKPLNSYVGQGNLDSNQGIDEDFSKNTHQNKKVRAVKQRPINEHTKKYAEILCQFINVINQDYKNHSAIFQATKQPTEMQDQQGEQIDSFPPNKNTKDNINFHAQQVVSKQQQKIRKSEININKHIIYTKKIKKDRRQVEQPPKNKQVRLPQTKIINTINVENKPPLPKQIANIEKQKIKPAVPSIPTPAHSPPNNNPFFLPPNQIGSLQQMQQIQMLQNQMLAMNSGMYSVYPYNMPPFMNPLNPNYPFLLEQMKNNPYMMNMFPSAMMPNCIPFSKLPFNKNGQPDQKKDETQAFKADNPPSLPNLTTGLKPQNAQQMQQFHQLQQLQQLQQMQQMQQIQQKYYSQQQQLTEHHNLHPNQQKQNQALSKPDQKPQDTKQKQKANQLVIQPINFRRKSCYHIAIAYNIHFASLKESGKLMGASNQQGYLKLDPTLPAKKVRQRNHPDLTPK